jgi:CubicO group peptidase (beta-lactamase class C family)
MLCFRSIAQASNLPQQHTDSHNHAQELTAVDLEEFLDTRVPVRLANSDIAGAVFVVVKNGQTLLSKAYGLADVKTKRPMSPNETLIRPGSIAKLFTWTAVMQQVELRNLDLDLDVNNYLDFKIPEAFGKAITLRNIMTHTTGFEDTFKQLITYKPERLVPLEFYVKNNIPARIYPPGEVVAYSNYAASLAGYIIERVSHQPFAEYVSRHILAPLNMNHSTFVQPLPRAFWGEMGSAYVVASQKAQPFELSNAVPSGALVTTGADMANFMIAQLQDGRFGDKSILKPATAGLMHRHQRSEISGFGGFALGFMDQTCDGHRLIGHLGNTQFWHSELELVTDANVGLFISTNSTGRLGSNIPLLSGIVHEFFDRYLGCGIAAEPTALTAKADSERVRGDYFMSLRPEASFLRLFELLVDPAVIANSDATIEVNVLRGGPDYQPVRWREIGPLIYREEGGYRRLGFAQDSSGHIDHMAVDDDPMLIFQRAPELHRWIRPLLGLSVLILIVTLVVWPIGFVIRSSRIASGVGTADPSGRRMRLMWCLSRLSCLIWLITFAGWAYLVLAFTLDLTLFAEPIGTRLYLLYSLGVISLMVSAIPIANAVLVWSNSVSRIPEKLAASAVAVAILYVSWLASVFHLISFTKIF